MMKLMTFIGMTIGGAIGSWVVGRFGIFAMFMGGIVGTAVGLYAGRKLAQRMGA
jgi:gas vesicle protein